ncbi:MMPL family transporter [Priestia filamentosa]|uniref:MMPL family transporter n=1 Tax=Priestia filamentosa TaxID=1402861 RepID=UPI00397DF638
MAKALYKLGYWVAGHKIKIISGTIAILIALGVLAVNIGMSFSDKMSIPNTESADAGELLQKEFPSSKEKSGGQVQLVFKAPKGETLDSQKVNKVIEETLNEIKKDDRAVTSIATPVQLGNLSENKKIGYATVTYKVAADKVTDSSKKIVKKNIKITHDAGIQTELAGTVAFSKTEAGGSAEGIGIIIAFIILAVTFTSFLAAGMPILTSIIGLAIGLLTVVIGTNFIDIPSVSLSVASMLGLAVGIDYALFIIVRFRQQLKENYSIRESIAIATGTAGSAVVFAGITVIIGLLGLSITEVPFLTAMGYTGAVSVLVAVFIAVIVVPAVLALMGHKMGPYKSNRLLSKITGRNKKQTSSNKWGEFVVKRPVLVAILGIVLLVVMSVPFFHMQLGLPDNGTKSVETTERRGYDLLSEAYGPGYHSSLVVVAKTDNSVKNAQKAATEIAEEIKDISNVKTVTPAIPGSSGKLFMISVTPKTGPSDLKTKDIVHNIRDKSNKEVELLVTGQTAADIDLSEGLLQALVKFAIIIVGFAFLLLVIVFRSLLVPLKAVLGFVLSLGATLGFVVFVVQDGHFLDFFGFPNSSPILNFLPVIVVAILFGLAMDYEVFLVSRMREEYIHTGDARKAVLAGMKSSGNVVTAAGLIMISVFTGFMLTPDPMVKIMGMALTFGVLFDAFIVRLAIVPAVMTLLGKSAWYLPRWMDKILPNIDIEGESIMKMMKRKEKEKERKRKLSI